MTKERKRWFTRPTGEVLNELEPKGRIQSAKFRLDGKTYDLALPPGTVVQVGDKIGVSIRSDPDPLVWAGYEELKAAWEAECRHAAMEWAQSLPRAGMSSILGTPRLPASQDPFMNYPFRPQITVDEKQMAAFRAEFEKMRQKATPWKTPDHHVHDHYTVELTLEQIEKAHHSFPEFIKLFGGPAFTKDETMNQNNKTTSDKLATADKPTACTSHVVYQPECSLCRITTLEAKVQRLEAKEQARHDARSAAKMSGYGASPEQVRDIFSRTDYDQLEQRMWHDLQREWQRRSPPVSMGCTCLPPVEAPMRNLLKDGEHHHREIREMIEEIRKP